ncbi:MAG: DgkA, partial [Thermoleophilia bacterium]|nr:DgkA [Thermoleophilia bacterium]
MIRWVRGKVRDSRRYAGLHEARPLVQSFNFAFDGVIHVLATQRNMRIHFIAAAGAMFACLFFGVTGLELSMVIFAAAFVIIS